MPRGDFVTRNSFYEALCAESIPVVMEPDYFKHCAFHDIINYREFVRILPEVSFMGNKSQNAVQMVKSDHETVRAAQMLLNLGQVSRAQLLKCSNAACFCDASTMPFKTPCCLKSPACVQLVSSLQ